MTADDRSTVAPFGRHDTPELVDPASAAHRLRECADGLIMTLEVIRLACRETPAAAPALQRAGRQAAALARLADELDGPPGTTPAG